MKAFILSAPPAHINGTVASGINGSNYVLHWGTEIGAQYQIQSSINLTNWVDIGSPISGTGVDLSWASALTNSVGYYRVITLP